MPLLDAHETNKVMVEILRERGRQDDKWGQQNWPDGTGPRVRHPALDMEMRDLARRCRQVTDHRAALGRLMFIDILLEEVFEAAEEADPAKLRAELIQVAAVAAAMAEKIDREAVQAA